MLLLRSTIGYVLKRCLGGGGRRYISSESRSLISLFSVKIDENKYFNFNFNFPAMVANKTEIEGSSSSHICLLANMPEVKKEDVKAIRVEEDKTVSFLAIEGVKYEESYFHGQMPKLIYIDFFILKNNKVDLSFINNPEMLHDDDGTVVVYLPLLPDLKQNNYHPIITNLIKMLFTFEFKLFLRLFSSIPTVVATLGRRYVVDWFCAYPWESFTMYKNESHKSVNISVTRGIQKMDDFEGGICISLNMPELKWIEEVNLFFKYDVLFIQGKTTTATNNKVRYITGIHLPESYTRKPGMIKEEMLQPGMYKATVPLVDY